MASCPSRKWPLWEYGLSCTAWESHHLCHLFLSVHVFGGFFGFFLVFFLHFCLHDRKPNPDNNFRIFEAIAQQIQIIKEVARLARHIWGIKTPVERFSRWGISTFVKHISCHWSVVKHGTHFLLLYLNSVWRETMKTVILALLVSLAVSEGELMHRASQGLLN